jgi:hypothetical protein
MFTKILIHDLLQDPVNVQNFFRSYFNQQPHHLPTMIAERIKNWHSQGKITEPNPIQFALNILSLCIFVFIGKPIIEAIFSTKIDYNPQFINERIASVTRILKQGMLP